MRALFCVGAWSKAGLIDRADLLQIAAMEDVKGVDDENFMY